MPLYPSTLNPSKPSVGVGAAGGQQSSGLGSFSAGSKGGGGYQPEEEPAYGPAYDLDQGSPEAQQAADAWQFSAPEQYEEPALPAGGYAPPMEPQYDEPAMPAGAMGEGPVHGPAFDMGAPEPSLWDTIMGGAQDVGQGAVDVAEYGVASNPFLAPAQSEAFYNAARADIPGANEAAQFINDAYTLGDYGGPQQGFVNRLKPIADDPGEYIVPQEAWEGVLTGLPVAQRGYAGLKAGEPLLRTLGAAALEGVAMGPGVAKRGLSLASPPMGLMDAPFGAGIPASGNYEDLLAQSMRMVEDDPAGAKAAFRGEAQEMAGDIAAEQAAKSGIYSEEGHLAKRVAAMTGEEPAVVRGRARERTRAGLAWEGPAPKAVEPSTTELSAGIPGTLDAVERETADILSKGFNGILENIVSIPSAIKRIQTGGDVLGMSGRQGLPTLFIDPKVWGTNTKRAARAYFESPQATAVMKEVEALPRFANEDVFEVKRLEDAVTDGQARLFSQPQQVRIAPMSKVLGLGDDFQVPGFERVNDSLVSRMADKFPLNDRSEKSMRVGMLGMATELRNGMIDAAKKAGVTDQSWYDHYGDIAKVAVGYGDVPKALKGMSDHFYSLRNVAARLQTLTQPITKPGAVLRSPGNMIADKAIFNPSPRGVAVRHAVRFAAGEMANLKLLAAAGAYVGLFEVGDDPLGPNFGRLTMMDAGGVGFSTDLLGGYGSLIKALAKTGEAAVATAKGETPRFDPAIEWLNFGRYKLSAVPSMFVDQVIQSSPHLRDVDGLKSPFALDLMDPKTWTSFEILSKISPFFASDPVQALTSGTLSATPDGYLKAGGALLAAWGGAPVSIYEPTTYSVAKQEFGEEYAKLDPLRQSQVLQKMESEGAKLTPQQRAKPWWTARDEALRVIREKAQTTPPKGVPPIVLEFLQEAKSYYDFREALVEDIKSHGYSEPEAKNKADKYQAALGLDDRISFIRRLVIKADPAIIDAVEASGYLVGAEMKKLAPAKAGAAP